MRYFYKMQIFAPKIVVVNTLAIVSVRPDFSSDGC